MLTLFLPYLTPISVSILPYMVLTELLRGWDIALDLNIDWRMSCSDEGFCSILSRFILSLSDEDDILFVFIVDAAQNCICLCLPCSMLHLTFVARSLQGHWWGFISRNYIVWPIFFLTNVFIAFKGTHFFIYIHNFKPLPSFYGCTDRFESTLVANPEDRFSRDVAHVHTGRLLKTI